jgi:hypothetical protein
MPPLLGFIHDGSEGKKHGYFWVEALMAFFGTISLLLKIKLYLWDTQQRGGILNSKTPNEKYQAFQKA